MTSLMAAEIDGVSTACESVCDLVSGHFGGVGVQRLPTVVALAQPKSARNQEALTLILLPPGKHDLGN